MSLGNRLADKFLRYRYRLEHKIKGEWVEFYENPFSLTDEEARAANEACKADYRFVRINNQPDRS